ncbi:component of IIS longevity pathway SMK-1-domain-containing protein [Chytriomyces sp. MP71]|nr:component of IIS longevity pathway SMK-1-domain-containing protein [Chytriomyces sp. MP71]
MAATPNAARDGHSASHGLRRVKVYQLDADGVWEDRGTGSVAVRDLTWIHVAHEEPTDSEPMLLRARIRREAEFIRQQDTLIVWTEEDGTDMALSFQEQEGCNELWSLITDIQRKLNSGTPLPGPDIDALPHPSEEEDNSQDESSKRDATLPIPSLSTIKEIEEAMFAGSKGAYGRNQLSKFILQENYIEKILPLLEMCEDMDCTDELYSLSHIMKMIVFLNEQKIYAYILQDDVFPIVVGMLEYDREYPSAECTYRQQVSSAKFRQLLPIPDPTIATKITHTYRLQFLRDTALARMLDDATFAVLNSMVFFNQTDIVTWFVGGANNPAGEAYLSKVIAVLNEEIEDGSDGIKRDEVVLFLHELSTVAKGMQVTLRAGYYRVMAKLGLFAIFDYTLVHDDIKIRLAAAAILASILDHDPSLVRSFCLAQVKQKQPQLLISLLISRFLVDPDPGLQSQLCELIRIILETDDSAAGQSGALSMGAASAIANSGSNDTDTDDFLNLFYEKCIDSLVGPILSLDAAHLDAMMDSVRGALCAHICSLLCYMIKSHSYRSKYYVLGSSITAKVILLLRARESYIRLAALRVFRVCFGMKDEFYNRHLIKHDIFSAILQCFRDTNGKYNLINSACLDVLEFIRKENVKSLVSNLVQNHKDKFADVTFVDTFKNLVLRYEQNQDVPIAGLGAEDDDGPKPPEKPKPDGWGKLDNDEEAYFNQDDDDDDAPYESGSTSMNVDRGIVTAASGLPSLKSEGAGTPSLATTAAAAASSIPLPPRLLQSDVKMNGALDVPPPPGQGLGLGSGLGPLHSNHPIIPASLPIKRSASPLGLVDYDDDDDDGDQEEDMFSAKNRARTVAAVTKNVSAAGAAGIGMSGGGSAREGGGGGGVAVAPAGNGTGRVSFSLNVAGSMAAAAAAKRRRTGSFASDEGASVSPSLGSAAIGAALSGGSGGGESESPASSALSGGGTVGGGGSARVD